jgi:hypothetical protein
MSVVRMHRYTIDPANLPELLRRRAALVGKIRSRFDGLAEARLTRLEDGSYIDAWRWDSIEQMKNALVAAPTLPEVGATMSMTSNRSAEDGEIVDEL